MVYFRVSVLSINLIRTSTMCYKITNNRSIGCNEICMDFIEDCYVKLIILMGCQGEMPCVC